MKILRFVKRQLILTILGILVFSYMLFVAHNIYHFTEGIVLPNHYRIFEAHRRSFFVARIVDNHFSYVEGVIKSNIRSYAIVGEVVVGEQDPISKSEEDFMRKCGAPEEYIAKCLETGFYVVHTRRMLVWTGLDEAKCRDILHTESGNDEIPVLKNLY